MCLSIKFYKVASSLVLVVFISYYQQYVSIVLQCGHAIAIFHSVAVLGKHSSSVPHITTIAPLLAVDLW
jgi:hypothetical protein